jgi:PAS domain S-box-containing protein
MINRFQDLNPGAALTGRAHQLFLDHSRRVHRWADQLFLRLLILQWMISLAIALWLTPLAWDGDARSVHPHVWQALLLGGTIVALPVWLILHRPGSMPTRLSVAVGQALISAMLIHLTGGRIETHFHVFCSLAVLAFYRDWRVLVLATVTVLFDHVVRGILFPQSVFGTPLVSWWRPLEHGSWAILEDAVLLLSINYSLRESADVALREAALERTRQETERIVADRTGALRASVARTQSILDAALDAIVRIDSQGRIIEFNPAAESTFGVSAQDVVGKPLAIMLNLPAMDELRDCQSRSGCCTTLNRRFEVDAIHHSGRCLPAEVAIVAIDSASPTYTAFIRDISERRQVEETLLKAKQHAEEASVAKSQFLAAMSHELRTPLNGVIGMTELLIRTDLDERQLQFVQACQNSGRSLLELINDVLDVSKIEAGKLELDAHDFDLEQLVRDTIDMIALTIGQKGLELICEFDPRARRIYSGDSTRMRQILVNLLSNAKKFTERGEIVLTVNVLELDDDEATLRFSVRDTGIGIPADRLHRLFQSFSQVDSSTTRKYGGTGLGLAICKHLVDALGGSIGVDSVVGEGSTFWFSLALPIREDCNLQSPTDANRFAGRRVLIVDDNATSRQILERQAQSWGMVPATADSVESALRIFDLSRSEGRPFDLVIGDDQMPEQTGIDLARAIKSRGAMPPFILMGSSTAEPTHHRARPNPSLSDCGIRQQLAKPVLSTQLFTAVQSVLQSQHSPSGSAAAADNGCGEGLVRRCRGELLIAEDNAVNALYVTTLLNQAGYATQTANNGLQAVLAVRMQQFSLVLMDCQMPELDGYEATRCIRNLEAKGRLSGRVPIIALTANAVKGDVDRCLEAGMDDYMSKPFEPTQLLRMVERLARPVESHDDFVERNAAEASPALGIGSSNERENEQRTERKSEPAAVVESSIDEADVPPPLDVPTLLRRCMGSLDLMDSLLAELESSGAGQVEKIANSFAHGDCSQTAEAAHALKGAAGIMGAESIRQTAATLEKAGRAGTLEGLDAAIADLKMEMNRCLSFIPTARQKARELSATAVGERSLT